MLHAVRYVKAAGGSTGCSTCDGGAQQDRFPAGPSRSPTRWPPNSAAACRAERRCARNRLGRRRGVAVGSTGRQVDGAIRHRRDPAGAPGRHRVHSPAARASIQQLAEPMAAGPLSKAYAAYDTPFWRTTGHSGQALSDEGPVFITFDVSPQRRRPGHSAGVRRRPHVRPAAAGAASRDARCSASPRCSGGGRERRSTTSTTVGAQSHSRREGRRPRCRRDRGPAFGPLAAQTGRTASTGRAPRPPTSGPASSTARCARGSARRRGGGAAGAARS